MVKCQACKEHEEQTVLKDPPGYKRKDKPYRLCQNCIFDLINRRLSRAQYKNLLKSGHKNTEFLLHGDFYDENGKALQPVRFRR